MTFYKMFCNIVDEHTPGNIWTELEEKSSAVRQLYINGVKSIVQF